MQTLQMGLRKMVRDLYTLNVHLTKNTLNSILKIKIIKEKVKLCDYILNSLCLAELSNEGRKFIINLKEGYKRKLKNEFSDA